MKQKPYTVHFVCRGNTFRSRLAASYMANLVDENYVITSSGIGTHRSRIQTTQWYTQKIAHQHDLTHEILTHKIQTSHQLLAAADIVIFMNKDVYDDASKKYDFDVRKVLVWNVADIPDAALSEYVRMNDEGHILQLGEAALRRIMSKCDKLYTYMTAGSWVGIVDKQNKSSELRLPISWVSDRGLWHRGVHVVVRTSDGKFVVGKRDKSMIYAPGMLEVTLGGAMDAGELPLAAARRETHEELGILLEPNTFRPLFVYRQIGYHPHYHKQTRAHLYVYAVVLPLHSRHFLPQPGEVEEIRLLTKRQLKRLLKTHRMKHFGRLKWGYKLYSKAVAYSALLS